MSLFQHQGFCSKSGDELKGKEGCNKSGGALPGHSSGLIADSFLRSTCNPFGMPEKTDMTAPNITYLMSELHKGTIRIPDFQRKYIWSAEQTTDLLDSIWNGYPIGSILLWRTKQELKEQDPLDLNPPLIKEGGERHYLLDGQQRLVTIYAVFQDRLRFGKRKTKWVALFNLNVALSDQNKTPFEILQQREVDSGNFTLEDGYIRLSDLIAFDFEHRSATINPEILRRLTSGPKKELTAERINIVSDLFIRFHTYQCPVLTNSQQLSTACKIFERLNISGTPLTIVDLMVATTYKQSFNLRDRLFLVNEELATSDFDLSERAILQCMAACINEGTSRDEIIESHGRIEREWKKTTEALKLAIDFSTRNCLVPVSKFLSYEIMLAPMTHFFYHYGGGKLSPELSRELKRYYWLNVFSERYGQSQDTRAREDIGKMNELLKGAQSQFDYHCPPINGEKVSTTDLSLTSGFACTTLCFLAQNRPLEFSNNEEVDLRRAFGDANQKQLHHVFPVGYLKSTMAPNEFRKIEPLVNSMANITLISKSTNREIWSKDPQTYFEEFQSSNSGLADALHSHFIGNLREFGIANNDFRVFIQKRSEFIAKEINAFLKAL